MSKKILVIGDIILDHFIYGKVQRLNPESPNPLLSIEKEEFKLGGAANVAANIASLWGDVVLCGRIGNDTGASEVERLCKESGIRLLAVRSNIPTILKRRYIELTYKQQLLRTDWEIIQTLSEAEDLQMRNYVNQEQAEVIILSDYNKWTVGEWIAKFCISTRAKTLVDTKMKQLEIFSGAYLIKPNFKEFSSIMDIHAPNSDTIIEKYGPLFMSKYQTNLVVTRSEKWASLIQSTGEIFHFAPRARDVFDVTGAWDTFMAALWVGTAEDMSLPDSVEFANKASSISVSRVGTTIVYRSEIG